MGIWDSNLKRLFGANPQDFVTWLFPGARIIRELSTHLNRDIDIDVLYEVELNGERLAFHLEFQRHHDVDMANRVLEYNVFASCKFDCTVVSFVIYLKKEGNIVEPPLTRKLPNGEEVLHFNFINIKLWETPTDELRRTGLIGLLPLLPLTREGGTKEVLEETITGIQLSEAEDEAKANLLSITLTLAALAFTKKEDRDWLIRRFRMFQDILRESEIYQLIVEEGREEGREEATQRELEDLRQLLLSFMQARFPELASFAIQQVSNIADIAILKDLTLKVGLSQTSEEVYQLLTRVNSKSKS